MYITDYGHGTLKNVPILWHLQYNATRRTFQRLLRQYVHFALRPDKLPQNRNDFVWIQLRTFLDARGW